MDVVAAAGEEEVGIIGEGAVEMTGETSVAGVVGDLNEETSDIRDHPLLVVAIQESELHSDHESRIPTFRVGGEAQDEIIEGGLLQTRHHLLLPDQVPPHGLLNPDDGIALHPDLDPPLPAGTDPDRLTDEIPTGAEVEEEEAEVQTMEGDDPIPQKPPCPALHVPVAEEDRLRTRSAPHHPLRVVDRKGGTPLQDLDLFRHQDLRVVALEDRLAAKKEPNHQPQK